MTRVALYTRVSTDRQEAENQRRQLRAFVKGNEGWKLVEEYRDEESGATGSRARFQALFEDAHQRKFEVLVFWALDRFSRQGTARRSTTYTSNYLHELELRRWLCILHRALSGLDRYLQRRAYRTTRCAGKPGEDSAIGSRESRNGESTNRGEARWPPAFGR